MAYSPIEHSGQDQAAILENQVVGEIARKHGGTPAQVALAWLLHQGVTVIPKASNPEHVRENRRALDIKLTTQDVQSLDKVFPKPEKKLPLAIR